MNSLTLMGKVNRDPQFGKDADVSLHSHLFTFQQKSRMFELSSTLPLFFNRTHKQQFRAFMYGNNNNNMNNHGGMAGSDTSPRSDSALSSESNHSLSPANSPSGGSGGVGMEKSVVDLDLIVEKWIAYMYEKTRGKSCKHELDDLHIVVNWKRVHIEQGEAKFDTSDRPSATSLIAATKKRAPRNQTLFRTFFTNRTDQEQEYSFKTERVTRQSVGFSFARGFSREKESGIWFKLPQDIVEIGGGMRSEQSVECGKDQTNEHEMRWGVDSLIRVRPHSKTSASLVISELELERAFFVETKLKGQCSRKCSVCCICCV